MKGYRCSVKKTPAAKAVNLLHIIIWIQNVTFVFGYSIYYPLLCQFLIYKGFVNGHKNSDVIPKHM